MGKYLPAVESDYLEIRLYAWQSRSIIDLSGAFRRTLENPWECAWFFLFVYIYISTYIYNNNKKMVNNQSFFQTFFVSFLSRI